MNDIEKAWQEYQRGLFYFVKSKVSITEDAEDIVNDVFMALTKTLSNKSPADKSYPNNMQAWLYHASKNRIIDYYRARKDSDPLPVDLFEEDEEESVLQELSKCMRPLILALPESYQRPLILSEIEGEKYKDIAEELGLSLPAVKSRILRGREKLHTNMLSCCAITKNNANETISFVKKPTSSCTGC